MPPAHPVSATPSTNFGLHAIAVSFAFAKPGETVADFKLRWRVPRSLCLVHPQVRFHRIGSRLTVRCPYGTVPITWNSNQATQDGLAVVPTPILSIPSQGESGV